MKPSLRGCAADQEGYTLVELIIAVAIGALLMSALTSVVLTTWRGTTIATSRVEASSQIRNFQFFAYDDFVQSNISTLSTCPSPCTSPITLAAVTYQWDGSNFLDRTNGQASIHAATGVKDFSLDVETKTVVVNLKITVQTYSQWQTFRFYPRVSNR
jgi:prepilin-type N-terminal cleavage/methylation domain-containing protein